MAGLIRYLSAFPLSTNETADGEVPAALATSEMVTVELMLKLINIGFFEMQGSASRNGSPGRMAELVVLGVRIFEVLIRRLM